MPHKYDFQEPESADYIFIDPDNYVHVLVPLVGGYTISTDNTCKTNTGLKTFLGVNEMNDHGEVILQKRPSALTILKKYKEALEHDIDLLENTIKDVAILIEKESRLKQIEAYITMMGKLLKPTRLENIEEVQVFGGPPQVRVIGFVDVFEEEIVYQAAIDITKKRNNCFGMRLSIDPAHEDPAVKIPNPVFEVKRCSNRKVAIPGLGTQLRETFSKRFEIKQQRALDSILETVSTHFGPGADFDFNELQQFLKEQIERQYTEKVDLSISQTAGFACTLYTYPSGPLNLRQLPQHEAAIIKHGDQYHMYGYAHNEGRYEWRLTLLDSDTINKAALPFPDLKETEGAMFKFSTENKPRQAMYEHIKRIKAHFPIIDQQYYLDNDLAAEEYAADEYANSILQTCLGGDFWDGLSNFFVEQDPEKLSVKVQFFLAQINVYCYVEGLSADNFGQTFDDHRVAKKIADAVKDALTTGKPSVEDALFSIIDEERWSLGLGDYRLTQQDKDSIIKNFTSQFKAVDFHDGKFDEFLVFIPERKGNFVHFKGQIAYHLFDLMEARFPGESPSFDSIRVNREHFRAYEGTYLSVRNDNLSGGDDAADVQDSPDFKAEKYLKIILSLRYQPDALAAFLCKKTSSGQFLFEVYPYAASFLQDDTRSGIEDQMKTAVEPDDVSHQIHLFITGYDAYDKKMAAFYPESMLPASLESIDEALAEIGEKYNDLRSWQWTRHKNRAGQLKDVNELLDLSVALSEATTTVRSRSRFTHDALKKLGRIYDDIQRENPWRRYFFGDTYLQRVVKSARNSIMTQLGVSQQDIETLANPEQNIIEAQTDLLLKLSGCDLSMEWCGTSDLNADQLDHFKQKTGRFQLNLEKIAFEQSHIFHELNAEWWLSENNLYLMNLISLPAELHTREWLDFFNEISPDQLDNFMTYCLETNKSMLSPDNPDGILLLVDKQSKLFYQGQSERLKAGGPLTCGDSGDELDDGSCLPLQKLKESIGIMCQVAKVKVGRGVLQCLARSTKSPVTNKLFPAPADTKKIEKYQARFEEQIKIIAASTQAIKAIKKGLIAQHKDLEPFNQLLTACCAQLSDACVTYKSVPTLKTQMARLDKLLTTLENTLALSDNDMSIQAK